MWKQDLIPKNIYWMPGFELMDEEKKSQVEGVQLRKLREDPHLPAPGDRAPSGSEHCAEEPLFYGIPIAGAILYPNYGILRSTTVPIHQKRSSRTTTISSPGSRTRTPPVLQDDSLPYLRLSAANSQLQPTVPAESPPADPHVSEVTSLHSVIDHAIPPPKKHSAQSHRS
ncbi:hypothetical protein S40285_10459 [Stachybotrys chlorohalonatus IBT 40285]|uniref:Uncharacterized protein n=1 Tax=Stachybotrys chlorohalonatus (strain IBT 40285) TaxID=1283841 RepID=A0A084QBC0_STAC4|nr:hypothetical protein S40285_10459 [Stachybotrys chlorohalonata IBT 40285]